MSQGVRTYDVEEANHALPEVRKLVERIVEISAALPDIEDQARVARYRAQRPDASMAEREEMEAGEVAMARAQGDLADAAIALQDMGVQLKDGRTGLVDFMSFRDGEVMELCWQLGEERVAHWHRIGEGFRGRKPL